MSAKVSHKLKVRGWFSEFKPNVIPEETGLYLVFGGKPAENNRAYINHLIYIGQAQDIQDRLEHHEKKKLFENELKEGESLYYYCVYLPNKYLDECEGAMIKYFNKHAKIINKKCINSFTASAEIVHIDLDGDVPTLLKSYVSFDISSNG